MPRSFYIICESIFRPYMDNDFKFAIYIGKKTLTTNRDNIRFAR